MSESFPEIKINIENYKKGVRNTSNLKLLKLLTPEEKKEYRKRYKSEYSKKLNKMKYDQRIEENKKKYATLDRFLINQ